ncbi:MAG: TIR domain-containing protein [Chitinophagaceae bacterium]
MDVAQNHIDVFISRKSADAAIAKELYHYLTDKGLKVFESDETLPKLGNSNFSDAIDHALDKCRHMIVVGSSVENIMSSWVKSEWSFYIGEKRADRKHGNILSVITGNIEIKDLPPALRSYEVIAFDKKNLERIAAYVGKNYEDPKFKAPRKNPLKSKWLLPLISVLVLMAVAWYFINESNKPFDATLFIKSSPEIKLDPSYPAFEGGELSLWLDDKEEKRTILPDGETMFKQIPVSFRDKKVIAKLTAKNWKLQQDTIELGKSVTLSIIPDESLAIIYGNVRDDNGNGISNCQIIIDNNDTTIFTKADGSFKINLPYQMQKPQYVLNVSKEEYKPVKEYYYAKSGNIDIELKK